MKSDLIENRQIRIFISSTFRDMMAERDHLVTRVFPALRRYCAERDVSIVKLDLRWGISEEESKQGKVVDICLKEIQKPRPSSSACWVSVMAGCHRQKNSEVLRKTRPSLMNTPG